MQPNKPKFKVGDVVIITDGYAPSMRTNGRKAPSDTEYIVAQVNSDSAVLVSDNGWLLGKIDNDIYPGKRGWNHPIEGLELAGDENDI